LYTDLTVTRDMRSGSDDAAGLLRKIHPNFITS